MSDVVKNQHFVPRTYLKRWADPKTGIVQVFAKKLNKFTSAKSPKSIGAEDFYYAETTGVEDKISQSVEKEFLPPFENLIGTEYPGLIERLEKGGAVSDYDRFLLCLIAAHLLTRGQGMRDQIADMLQQLQAGVERIVPNAQDYPSLKEIFEDTNATHLAMLPEVQGFLNTLSYKKLRIARVAAKLNFITSDKPVLGYAPRKDRGPYPGVALAQQIHTLPLHPKYFVEFYPPDEIAGKYCSIRNRNDDWVARRNAYQIEGAKQFGYGLSKDDFYKGRPPAESE